MPRIDAFSHVNRRLPYNPNILRYLATAVIAIGSGHPAMKAQDSVPIAVPLQVDRTVSLMMSINHGTPGRFCLDTGLGGPPILSRSFAVKLGLPTTGKTTLEDPSGQGSIAADTTLLDHVQIAGATFTNIDAAVQADSPMLGECVGVVGLGLFRDYLLTIDLAKGELRMERGHLSPTDRGAMPYKLVGGVPQVQMTIGRTTLGAQIDTMGRGLSLPVSAISALHLSTPPSVIGRARTLSGDFEIRGTVVDDDLRLGPYNYNGSFVEFNSHFAAVNLGLASLRTFTLRFDQSSRIVQFSASQAEIIIPPPHMGLRPTTTGQTGGPPD